MSAEIEATLQRMKQASERAHTALHTLWTSYVHTPGYDKATWLELSNALAAIEVERRRLSGE
jgi:hypothetical protein